MKTNNYFCSNALWFYKTNILNYICVDGDILTKKFMENLLKGPCYGHTCNQLMSL